LRGKGPEFGNGRWPKKRRNALSLFANRFWWPDPKRTGGEVRYESSSSMSMSEKSSDKCDASADMTVFWPNERISWLGENRNSRIRRRVSRWYGERLRGARGERARVRGSGGRSRRTGSCRRLRRRLERARGCANARSDAGEFKQREKVVVWPKRF